MRLGSLFALSVAVASAPRLARAGGPAGIPENGELPGALHVTVDATFTYGIGGYSALGGQLHGVGQLSFWNTRDATGSFDFGLLLGAQGEPQAIQPPGARGQWNDAQRLNAWVTLGQTFHVGRYRLSGLGFHLFAGWTHVFSQASFERPELGLSRRLSDDYGLPNVGALVKYDYRFSERVGFTVQAAGPFPVSPSYVTTLFHVGVGLVGYLR